MNDSLLAKLFWQWISSLESFWARLWREKYGESLGGHDPNLRHGASALSKGWFLNKEEFGASIQWKVGNGNTALFWLDSWCGEGSFKVNFPDLFRIASEKSKPVAYYWRYLNGLGGWNVRFTRGLLEEEREQDERLQGLLRSMQVIPSGPDKATWQVDPTSGYSTRQGYIWFMRNKCHNAELAAKQLDIWRPRVPLKIKIFM
ncbi:hypothetical protein QJS10_CPB17g00829 [Acorus calamus]|uniref:Reverse transcriptase zinc-binding domain-containing protein n=1 Tax=Acorus calamus TaxID=4465 RepID=A0AAV9CSC5_ACOCL|nr:hypothetical protein QJS10_CPB17g00829 [Acorus calamus]